MKTRLPKQVPKLTGDQTKDIANIASATQTIIDDLTTVINSGLTMADGNLPFSLYKRAVTNNQPFEITGFGATVIASSSKVTGFSTKLLKFGLLQVTISLDGATSDVILLVIGESAR